jgi:hypothetical protein
MRRALARTLALAAAAAVAGGCIDALDPKTGPAIAARCVDDDSDPGASVSFAKDIQPIFDMRCKFCHYPTGGAPIGLETTGLDLSSHAAVLAGAAAGPVVVAGQPCASILYEKVSPGPPFGSRMPLNGPPFLTDAQLQLIHDWIAEGGLAN